MRRTSGSRRASCPLLSPVTATSSSYLPEGESGPTFPGSAVRWVAVSLLNPRRRERFRSRRRRRRSVARRQGRAAQLPAGRVDVGPLPFADLDAHARTPEDRDEVRQGLFARPAIGQTYHVVERNQVHVRL